MARVTYAADYLVSYTVGDGSVPSVHEVRFTIPSDVPTGHGVVRSWRVQFSSGALDDTTYSPTYQDVEIDGVLLGSVPTTATPSSGNTLTGLAPDLGTGTPSVEISFPGWAIPGYESWLGWTLDWYDGMGEVSGSWPVVPDAYDLRVWYTIDSPTILRQRQSPRATPSRVRTTDLRAKQTPYI
jgi:hypothetical protein